MKRDNLLFISLIIGILFPSLLNAQRAELDWGLVNLGKETHIADITSIGEDTLIACGRSTIIKSVDAGKTWQTMMLETSASNEILYKIEFADSKVGYILGKTKLLKTINGGDSWNIIYNCSETARDLFIYDKDTLYMTKYSLHYESDTLFKSIDGGLNWHQNFIYKGKMGFNGAWINNVFFVDNTGYLVTSKVSDENKYEGIYDYNVFKTDNYGNVWDSVAHFENIWQSLPGLIVSYSKRASELYFTNKDNGSFYMEHKTISTKDGFKTFETTEGLFGEVVGIDFHFQTNGKHCFKYSTEQTYLNPPNIPITVGYDYYMKYSNDNGNTWILGKKDYKPSNEDGITYTSVLRTGDSVFYLGSIKGIFRSPAFPSSIDKVNTFDFNLYPNPVTSEFAITSNNLHITKIEIFDLLGNRVLSKMGTENLNNQIDCCDLKTGIYIVKITTPQGICTKKISKL